MPLLSGGAFSVLVPFQTPCVHRERLGRADEEAIDPITMRAVSRAPVQASRVHAMTDKKRDGENSAAAAV